MKVLITGVCGFVGSSLTRHLLEADDKIDIIGLDNFSRHGSYLNRGLLKKRGVKLVYGDMRAVSDFETLPKVDWIIDAAANSCVLAGVDGTTSSRQLIEHNLLGTVNILEYAKAIGAGFILLSTSRVYSIEPLVYLKVEKRGGAFWPARDAALPQGCSPEGISEEFATSPPVSLYGSSKIASEVLALEYGATFNFPVWINRCGVLAGAGQFGRADQGIFAYWINAHLRRRPLKYIGFDGTGAQTRDCLHPRDLVPLVMKQMAATTQSCSRILNLGGGPGNAMSLANLTAWCNDRFGQHEIGIDAQPRQFDIPWLVMDSRLANRTWDWEPETSLKSVLEEIAAHAEQNPRWLELSGAYE